MGNRQYEFSLNYLGFDFGREFRILHHRAPESVANLKIFYLFYVSKYIELSLPLPLRTLKEYSFVEIVFLFEEGNIPAVDCFLKMYS